MDMTKAQAAGGAGWIGTAWLLIEKVDGWINPTNLQVIQAQYSEGLAVIAKACNLQ